ncbi:Cytochrome P450 [Macleaya cordata]|uniref:Cytochrome P450 n=1 Tax=Macleaya cordata TaxID=56857 RepID=A0A200QY67_MACCD|nr:Cytochrome P450 [Macleaya cordata]
MDSHDLYQFSKPTIFIGGLFALVLYFVLIKIRSSSKTSTKSILQQPPEPAGAWPIIGHLPLLGGPDLPHITLGKLADKYGPAFTIRIGVHKALVINSWEVAKECFTTNDKFFSSRPRQVAMKHMGYNFAMFGFAPYGHYWRELRKIVNREVLSHSRIESLHHVWGTEVNTSLKELYDSCAKKNNGGGPVLVEMKRWFSDMTLNMSVMMVAGKRFNFSGNVADDEARRCQEALRNFFRLVGLFVPSDALPFLAWLDIGGYEKEMKKVARELDVLMQEWLEEHKEKRLAWKAEGKKKKGGEKDFMDVMMTILEDETLSDFDADTVNKATCLTLILGGTDTNMVNLVWALTLLVNNQDALKKAHDELDFHVGRDRQVEESDVKNLVYLQAIMKETLRLYSGPLSGLRESTEDCTVAGYHVPAGTRLIINAAKIHRDPQVWSDPTSFKPDRFLTENKNVDVRGQDFELLPFGAGRRICPGVSFALQVLPLALARLIHGFDFKTPTDAPIDMTESPGLTNAKSTPLDVLVSPRLSPKLYTFLYFLIFSWSPTKSKLQQPPEPAGAWPIVGHLPLLGGSDLPHIALGKLADKYGPVFTIRIGVHKSLVVSSWEVTKECFTTNDKVWSSRPCQVAMKHMGTAMFGFSPYGHYWRELRKIMNREVLSHSRIESLYHVWGSEINTSVKELYDLWAKKNNNGTGGPVLVEMKRWFSDLTLNMSVMMAAGKRYNFGDASTSTGNDEAARCQNALREFFRLVGQFVPSDALPFLGWLDIGGYEKQMKKVAKELDDLMQVWLDEHKKKRLAMKAEGKKGGDEQDFMDVMMNILDDGKLSDYYDADTINKATCLTLIVGGSDTMMISLVWALSLLVNHPHVLRKAQDELDSHVGKERQVDESDIKNLIYFQAVVKETLRLCPPGPLLTPRESTEDCTIAGYHVPAGTRLLVNIWKIQRDPRVWSDPSKFQPDRFLTGSHANMDVRGQNFELIPFGLGRRSCPGTNLALQVVRLTLARLIHGFEFKTPSNTPIDMTGSAGITNAKATPLDVLVTPRLPSKLYIGVSIHFRVRMYDLPYCFHLTTTMDSDHLIHLYYYYYQFSTPSMIILGLFALLVYYFLLRRPVSGVKNNKSKNQAPEAAGAWPIIGNLHQLAAGGTQLHVTLGDMADKHGPAFTIRMGLHKALIVSSWEIAKECFTTNDMVFNSRPHQVAVKYMGYGTAMFGIAPYGPYYREMRKIVTQELLSNRRLELLKHVWISEVNTSIKQLYEKVEGRSVLVEMKRWSADLTLKTTIKLICGKGYFGRDTSNEGDEETGKFQTALRDFFRLLGHFRVADVIPFLERLDFQGYKKEMKDNGRVLDSLMAEWLEEHKKKRLLTSSSSSSSDEGDEGEKKGGTEQDFMDVMMSKLNDEKLLSYYDADTINKSTCLTLILGGSDTTMVSLSWALSLLVNHPHVLKKAQDELDTHVGKERQVDDSDIKNLTYLQAIIKETLRLYPAGPLSAPRESTDDCTVAGYHIPKGTRLIVNAWKIQRDPRVWPDPSEFKPERFLTTHVDVDVRGQNFELLPFGSGRRACPGASFALQVLRLTLARLIHGFEFKRPMEAQIDMIESGGITNVRANPLDVLVTPRLPSKLYV